MAFLQRSDGWSSVWRNLVSSLTFANRKKNIDFSPLRLIHGKLLFGHLIAGDALGAGGWKRLCLLGCTACTPTSTPGAAIRSTEQVLAGHTALFSTPRLTSASRGWLSLRRVSHPDPKPLVTKQGRGLKCLNMLAQPFRELLMCQSI